MSITLSTPRSLAGLSATAVAVAPSTNYREAIGAPAKQIALTAATKGREIGVTFGAIGNNIVGTVDGSWALTGSTTGTKATGTLTLAGNAVADETVTIGSKVYTWKATVGTTSNQVKIGTTASDSIDNLIAAINKAAGGGTTYGSNTVAHTQVVAAVGAGDTMGLTAKEYSSSYNTVATTATMTAGSWGAATLTGGVTPCVVEGEADADITGTALPALSALDGFEIRVHAGGVSVSTSNSKIAALTFTAPAVLHIAGTGLAALATVTITATAADTTATVAALYH
jgi:hypothetical protein